MKNLWVYYTGGVSNTTDSLLKKTVHGFGGKWYGSGKTFMSGERDNSFHVPDDCIEIICAKLKKMGFRYEIRK